MPKDVKVGSKDVAGTLDNHTYPSDVDNMVRKDMDFEGSSSSMPPAASNPAFGADGSLPNQKISKIK